MNYLLISSFRSYLSVELNYSTKTSDYRLEVSQSLDDFLHNWDSRGRVNLHRTDELGCQLVAFLTFVDDIQVDALSS